jgi:hypothetical protein
VKYKLPVVDDIEDPNAIERTPAPDEANIPVFKITLLTRVNVPAVNVYVPVAVSA